MKLVLMFRKKKQKNRNCVLLDVIMTEKKNSLFFSRFQSFRQKCECETFGKHSFKAQHIFALK